MSERPEPAGPGSEPEPEASALDRVAELEAELAQLNSDYRRLAADFENFRRRKGQETEDLARYGSTSLLLALLPALDNLQRAVGHLGAEASDGLSEGLRLTVRQLEEALGSQGVRRIATQGEPFDPRLHEAVLTVPTDRAEPGTVVAELAPGYTLHDRTVRPAQVSVAEAGPGPKPGREPRRSSRSRSGGATLPGPDPELAN